MPGCAIATCKNTNRSTKGSNIKYFGFPKHEDLLKQWIHACWRKEKINLKNARICSIHFDKNCLEIPLRHRLLQYSPKTSRNLKPDAVPTLHLPGSCQKYENIDEQECIVKKSQKKIVDDLLKQESLPIVQVSKEEPQSGSPYCDNAPLIDVINTTIINIEKVDKNKNIEVCEVNELRIKINLLEKQNRELLRQVKSIRNFTSARYENILATVFTPGQIKKLFHPEKDKIRWSLEDIVSAISLRNVSQKAYKYLQTNNYPLPALSTLRKYVSNSEQSHGILKNGISFE